MRKLLFGLLLTVLSISQMAYADPFYCTGNNAYINVGMSADEVEQACGAPQTIQKSQQDATQKVPVSQLTFNVSTNTTGAYAGTVTPGVQSSSFQINTGPLTTLIVSVKNNQISSISLNGESAQSVSICGNGNFGIGDPPSSATSSCGSPVSENDTYENVSTGQSNEVDTWTYHPGNYQPDFSLIFVNDVLSQINR